MEPVSIHIPPELRQFAISPSEYCKTHTDYERIVVGAFIFRQLPEGERAMLLVQRAATEPAFPNLWEVPGGSAEDFDPTILHSVAREVFEETGLHLTRVIREVGKGVSFMTKYKCLKLSFEIEVAEIEAGLDRVGALKSQNTVAMGSSNEGGKDEVLVTLDPVEHQRYAWVAEENVKSPFESAEKLLFTTKDQEQTIITAFALHRTAKNASAELFAASMSTKRDDYIPNER